ncbi:MAG TPA: glutamine synthetase family protein [Acidimicrobiales bacterium]|nr:glutamine synthetase family protein [Acidimicrobiales bacterium]
MTIPDLSGVAWVRLTFVDVFGTGNSVQLPAERFAEACERGLPFDGSALEGRARHFESDMLLMPDPETVTSITGDTARVVCTAATIEGAPWAGDPRTALATTLSRYDDLREVYTASAELEFYILDREGQPVDAGGYYDEEEGPGDSVTRTAAARLRSAGVRVNGCHHEAGPGQYEINLAPAPPMALADGIVMAKQLIKEAAQEQGVRATFMPRPLNDLPGSGLHIHQRAGDAFFDEKGRLTDDGRRFVAGQLTHARALSALAAPTVNSYKRLHSGPEAPSAAFWAYTSRAALIRVSSFRGDDASIEYRAADPSSNPYLLFAALLSAGAHGLEADLELGPPGDEDVGGYDPAGESQRYQSLPRDLDSALDALLEDDVLVDSFDPQLLNRLVDGRRSEAEAYRAHVTTWERGAYLEQA